MKIQFSIITGRFASNPFIVMFSYSLHFRSPTIIFSFWLIRVVAKKYAEQQPITSNSNLRQATKRDIGSYHNDRDAITANIHFVLSLIEHFPVFPLYLYICLLFPYLQCFLVHFSISPTAVASTFTALRHSIQFSHSLYLLSIEELQVAC